MSRRALLALALLAAPLAAQDPEPEAAPPRVSYFPYLTSTPNDGVFGVARIIRFRQAPWDARVTNLREHSLDLGFSTRSSYLVRGDYKRLWLDEGWRARLRVEATRETHFGNSDDAGLPTSTPIRCGAPGRTAGSTSPTGCGGRCSWRCGARSTTRSSPDRSRR